MNLGQGSRVEHEELGVGVVLNQKVGKTVISFVRHGIMDMTDEEMTELRILETVDPPADMVSLADIQQMLTEMLDPIMPEVDETELGAKWEGGTLTFQPGNPDLKPYELPVETFFHKIVMVRDRLRVMEQRINASNLTDEEKVNLQQYITKIYGSLTSFNILFDQREDGFVGSGKGS